MHSAKLNPMQRLSHRLILTQMPTSCKQSSGLRIRSYHHNFPDVPYLQRDVTGLTYLIAILLIFRNYEIDRFNADVWLLSPPCQPHTRQGMRLDCSDTRSDGLLHLISLLQVIKNIPKFILLENVEGFESSESRNRLVTVLKERQYYYQEFILSPNQFQIPNQRDRYFLVARLTEFPPVPENTPRIKSCLRIIPGDATYLFACLFFELDA